MECLSTKPWYLMLRFMPQLNNTKITSNTFNIFVMKMASPETCSPYLGAGIKLEERDCSQQAMTAVPGRKHNAALWLIRSLNLFPLHKNNNNSEKLMRRRSMEQHGDAQWVSLVPCGAAPGLGDHDGIRMGPGWDWDGDKRQRAVLSNQGACRCWSHHMGF